MGYQQLKLCGRYRIAEKLAGIKFGKMARKGGILILAKFKFGDFGTVLVTIIFML